nr:NUDIX domain-containing protein [Corynebacterium lactis]
MAIPEFIVKLREKIGHAPLWLPGVTAVVIRDVPPGAPIYQLPEVLLVKRSDNGEWTPVTGIIDPNEEPHDAAVREVKEETGLDVTVEALLGTGAVGPVEYPNGDVTSYVDVAMRCAVVGDDVPHVADDESVEVGWFQISKMPPMKPRFRLIIADAVAQLNHAPGFRPRMGYYKRG